MVYIKQRWSASFQSIPPSLIIEESYLQTFLHTLVVTAAIMVIVIAYQVVLRYVFHASNAWSEELARYLFIYDVFIGSAIALRKSSHLQVDVFLNLMKERTKYIYTIVVTILGILFLAVLFVYSISLCKISAVNITPGLQVSMAIPYACMPLGAVLMILTSFEVIGKNVEKLKQCKKGADV